MSEVANDTGAGFFHKDNDPKRGLRKVTAHSEFGYVLAF
jgi:hypothetical protein